DSELLPRQFRWIAILQRAQFAAVDDELASVHGHRFRVTAVHRVKTKQVRHVLDVGQVVDGDQLQLRPADDQLQDRTPDPPETIDGDPSAHNACLRAASGFERSAPLGGAPCVAAVIALVPIVCRMSFNESTNFAMPSSRSCRVTCGTSIPARCRSRMTWMA